MTCSIYALHEGPVDWLGDTPGHVVLTVHAWQSDQVDVGAIVAAGHIPLVRVNNGYGSEGTIPRADGYEAFAQRLGLVAKNSPQVHHWIVGNEPNHPNEWPGGQRIYPDEYARCYLACRQAIRSQMGHQGDQVLVAAIAPWCALVTYAGNERGDWVRYLADVISRIDQAGGADGYALHTYTHTHSPGEVTSTASMDAPFGDRFYQFRAYRDFMAAIPAGAPAYITECCPVESGWLNVNNEWVQAAYREIDKWNKMEAARVIRCLALYRGVPVDRWYFADKGYVRMDWNAALARGYTVPDKEPPGNGGAMEVIWSTGFEDGNWDGWTLSWKPGEKPGPVQPEVQIEDTQRGDKGVRSGRYGVKLAHTYSWFDAVLVRTFPATPGKRYQARGWSTAESNGGLGCQIGIADGAPFFTNEAVQWTEWWGTDLPGFKPYTWLHQTTPAITASGDKVTVYLRVTCRDAVQVNAGFWDDVALLAEAGGGQPPAGGGTHRVRVYLDDELIVDEPFEAEVSGLTFRATGVTPATVQPTAKPKLLRWLFGRQE